MNASTKGEIFEFILNPEQEKPYILFHDHVVGDKEPLCEQRVFRHLPQTAALTIVYVVMRSLSAVHRGSCYSPYTCSYCARRLICM